MWSSQITNTEEKGSLLWNTYRSACGICILSCGVCSLITIVSLSSPWCCSRSIGRLVCRLHIGCLRSRIGASRLGTENNWRRSCKIQKNNVRKYVEFLHAKLNTLGHKSIAQQTTAQQVHHQVSPWEFYKILITLKQNETVYLPTAGRYVR